MEVHRVPVETPGVPGGTTNAYVVGRNPGLLVDPPQRDDRLDELVVDREVTRVFPTHGHPDHVGGLTAYAEAFDLTILGPACRPERVTGAGRRPDRLLHAGDTVPVGERTCRVLATPGHAPEHRSLELPTGAVICGDTAIAYGSVAVGAPEGDMRAYLTTLRRLWAREPPTLYPGHGPVIEDPRETLERLVAHRLDRERRVQAAVEDGADSIEAILDAAYDKDLSGHRDMAAATVRAHLEKLVVEGAVSWPPDRS